MMPGKGKPPPSHYRWNYCYKEKKFFLISSSLLEEAFLPRDLPLEEALDLLDYPWELIHWRTHASS